MIISKEKYKEMAEAFVQAEKDSISGKRAQVVFDTEFGNIWTTHFPPELLKTFVDGKFYFNLYDVEPWEEKLKDLYKDDDNLNDIFGIDWNSKDYLYTWDYEDFYNWYFGDCVNGFAVYKILDEALERKGIAVGE